VIDDEGLEIELPTRWEICDMCRGEGKESAYLGAFTSEDFAEDYEFFEDYMAGRYDRTCEACRGTGKVKVVDEDRCEQRLLEMYWEQERAIAECDQMSYLERMMGA
jgi:RecJ-like exonuclease